MTKMRVPVVMKTIKVKHHIHNHIRSKNFPNESLVPKPRTKKSYPENFARANRTIFLAILDSAFQDHTYDHDFNIHDHLFHLHHLAIFCPIFIKVRLEGVTYIDDDFKHFSN